MSEYEHTTRAEEVAADRDRQRRRTITIDATRIYSATCTCRCHTGNPADVCVACHEGHPELPTRHEATMMAFDFNGAPSTATWKTDDGGQSYNAAPMADHEVPMDAVYNHIGRLHKGLKSNAPECVYPKRCFQDGYARGWNAAVREAQVANAPAAMPLTAEIERIAVLRGMKLSRIGDAINMLRSFFGQNAVVAEVLTGIENIVREEEA